MNYSRAELIRSPGYEKAAPEERLVLLRTVDELEAREAGVSVKEHQQRRQDRRERKTEQQQKRRRKENSDLYEVKDLELFSVIVLKHFVCKFCGESFKPKRKTAKFCSAKCRVYWHRSEDTRVFSGS